MTLQEWHKTEGRTQTWAARQVGVPIWTYNKWYNGRCKPTDEHRQALPADT
jgi:DNA-binding XRE family transcriptional regulator